MTPEEIAALMRTSSLDPAMQVIQTGFRYRVVDAFGIAPGSRVLEIACGQGDTTAVLADRVGPDGSVVAIDPAPPGYGAPITVGESLAHLQAGPLGSRIEVLLGPDAGTYGTGFDYAVLSLGSFYFASRADLLATLQRARASARVLCFAEWELAPRLIEQVPHLLAILVQGQAALFTPDTTANVRTVLSRQQLVALVEQAGWRPEPPVVLDAAEMHDGRWEIGAAEHLQLGREVVGFADLASSQRDVIGALGTTRSLDVYAFTAT